MNKEQLLGYLRAVYSGETALAACIEMEKILRQQIDSLSVVLPKPHPPLFQYENPPARSEKSTSDIGIGTVVWAIIIDFILFMAFAFLNRAFENEDGSGGAPLVLVLLFLAGLIIGGPVLGKYLDGFVQKKVNERRSLAYRAKCARDEQKAKSEYDQEMQAYRHEMERIDREEHKYDVVKDELRAIIIENKEAKRRIKEELEMIYGRNIIQPRFRTQTAVSRIYEYLSAGACDKLEGPDGAYEMYCNNVHWAGISMNADVSALKENMDCIRNTVSSAVADIRAALQNGADAASGQREEVRRALSAATYNQYAEQCENDMSTWLLKNPY